MSSSMSSGGPDDGIIEVTFPKYIHGTSSTSTSTRISSSYFYGPNTSVIPEPSAVAEEEKEERIASETPTESLQPSQKIMILCPICETAIEATVIEKFTSANNTTGNKVEEIVLSYDEKTCDCPDVTIRSKKKSEWNGF